jgi:hypothetical protein
MKRKNLVKRIRGIIIVSKCRIIKNIPALRSTAGGDK